MNSPDTTQNHATTDKVFAAIALIGVIAGIFAGFSLLGSPNRQRLISLDEERVGDLRQITGYIRNNYSRVGEPDTNPPPAQLSDIDVLSSAKEDPITKEPYEYRVLSDSSYELCATFATSSLEEDSSPSYRRDDDEWAHPEGRHCYEFDVDDGRPKS